MRPPTKKESFVDLANIGGTAGREDFQSGWHTFVGQSRKHQRILDVGAGLGHSRYRLENNESNWVVLQDPSESMTEVDTHQSVYNFKPWSFHTVTAFDVIEHVDEDWPWLANLLRIASHSVILTTPNILVSEAKNHCHIREYTPLQLYWMCSRLGSVIDCRDGMPDGSNISKTLTVGDFVSSTMPHLYIEIGKTSELLL
jgi:hypothetical protein